MGLVGQTSDIGGDAEVLATVTIHCRAVDERPTLILIEGGIGRDRMQGYIQRGAYWDFSHPQLKFPSPKIVKSIRINLSEVT